MGQELSKRSTLDVVVHHNAALNSGNLEETMLDYGEGSFIITPNGVICGFKEIKTFFCVNIEEHLPPETVITYHTITANGKMGYTRWEAKSPFVTYLMGSDTFIVENGVIIMQSFSGYTG